MSYRGRRRATLPVLIAIAVLMLAHAGARAAPSQVKRISFVDTPARGSTYELGETIEVEVEFDGAVTVSGTPRLRLTIGAHTRSATFFLRSDQYWGFFYTVQVEDRDVDGISIAADALTLGGRSSRPAVEGLAEVDLTHPAVAADPDRQVDGSRITAPRVRSVTYTHGPEPVSGDTYGQGERIQVLVEFDRSVTVTGSPQIGLRIGLRKRVASYYPVDFVDLGSSVGTAMGSASAPTPCRSTVGRSVLPATSLPRPS